MLTKYLKFGLMALAMMLLVVVSICMQGCSNEENPVEPVISAGILQGRVVGNMDVPQSEVDALEGSKRQQLGTANKMSLTAKSASIYQWKFGMRDLAISIINQDEVFSTTITDSLGYFSIPKPQGDLSSYTVVVEFSRDGLNGRIVEASLMELLKDRKSGIIELLVPFSNLPECCLSGVSSGLKGDGSASATACTACLDNNGYHSWGRSTPRWIGFYGSDCWLALVFRTNCRNHSYCNGTRNCSPLIGHQTCWHWWWQR